MAEAIRKYSRLKDLTFNDIKNLVNFIDDKLKEPVINLVDLEDTLINLSLPFFLQNHP